MLHPQSISTVFFARRSFACFSLFLFVLVGATADAAGRPERAAVVTLGQAQQQMMAPTEWVTGSVISRDDAQIAAEIEGRLQWIAREGAQVKKGGAIARLDPIFVRLKRDEQEAEIVSAQARLDFLQREMRRLQRLAKSNNTAQTLLDQTRSDKDVAKSELALSKIRLKQAREQLKRMVITAPFGGVIATRLVRMGEWVSSGDAVVRLVDPLAVEIKAGVAAAMLPFLHSGTVLDVTADGRHYEGIVRTVIAVADERSHLLDLRLDISAPLVVGQAVRISVPTALPRQVIAVPRDALVMRRSGISVYRVNADDSAERVSVTTGLAVGSLIEVVGDIAPGDRVVTRGGERLRPGQKVRATGGADAAAGAHE
ncbi:MAG: efflux RND transporter periplasmic adaptor subunit [Gammaproteobacteria bacterium]|nr:efflux RND transporter periplasmic adaptor subunit [Gammaproteobacteria bacterium]